MIAIFSSSLCGTLKKKKNSCAPNFKSQFIFFQKFIEDKRIYEARQKFERLQGEWLAKTVAGLGTPVDTAASKTNNEGTTYDEYYDYEDQEDQASGSPQRNPISSSSFPQSVASDLAAVKAILLEFSALKSQRKAFDSQTWKSACHAIWWPFEDDYCHRIRCLTCSAAVIGAHTVCQAEQNKVHSCMQRVILHILCSPLHHSVAVHKWGHHFGGRDLHLVMLDR